MFGFLYTLVSNPLIPKNKIFQKQLFKKQYEEDIKEMDALYSQATRDYVKKSLEKSLNSVKEEVSRLQKIEKQRLERQTIQTAFCKKM